jgi:hypothetical protein
VEVAPDVADPLNAGPTTAERLQNNSFGDMSSIMIMPDQIYNNNFNLLDDDDEESAAGGGTLESKPIEIVAGRTTSSAGTVAPAIKGRRLP